MNVEAFRADAARRGYGEIAEVAWRPGYAAETHTHDFGATLFVLEGEVTVGLDGRTVTCRAGERFTLAAGAPHSERAGPDGARFLVGRAAAGAETDYAARARYFDSSVAFAIENPPVPCRQFTEERDRAFDPATGSAAIAVDQGPAMGLDFPATTPLALAHYIRVAAGERLPFASGASAELYYVIDGAGESAKGCDRIRWRAGDVFALPGGGETIHAADSDAAVLWAVTNAPALAFDGLAPPPPECARMEAVLYPGAEIARRMTEIRPKLTGTRTPGIAVVFSSSAQERGRNVAPGLTFAMNQLPPFGSQLAHRHNSVAVSLAVNAPQGSSLVEGERVAWAPFGTVVTPPGAVHSHRNDGAEWAHWLIVQDGGYHYHCRTMEFRYADSAAQ